MTEHYVFILVDKRGRLIGDRAFDDKLGAEQARPYIEAEVKKIRLVKR